MPELVLHFPTLTCLFLSLAQTRGGTGAGGGLAGKLEDHWIRPLLCFIETDVMMILVRMMMMMMIMMICRLIRGSLTQATSALLHRDRLHRQRQKDKEK